MRYYVDVDGEERILDVVETAAGPKLRERDRELDARLTALSDGLWQLRIDRRAYAVRIRPEGDALRIHVAGASHRVLVEDERTRAGRAVGSANLAGRDAGTVRSVMPGIVVRLLVETGADVEANQPVLVLEAMKMENEVRTPIAGTVTEVCVSEGQSVQTGAVLVRIG